MVILENPVYTTLNKNNFYMCNRFCFQAQRIINRYFTHMNIQRHIWKCKTWEKFFQVQPCSSHYKIPHLHETGPLITSSTLQSIAASRKHTHRFPALAWGARAAVALKTTTLDKPLAVQAQLASGVRLDPGGAKEAVLKAGCRLSAGGHHPQPPRAPAHYARPIRSSAELPSFQEKVDIWIFLCEISFFKKSANTFQTITICLQVGMI